METPLFDSGAQNTPAESGYVRRSLFSLRNAEFIILWLSFYFNTARLSNKKAISRKKRLFYFHFKYKSDAAARAQNHLRFRARNIVNFAARTFIIRGVHDDFHSPVAV